MTQPRNEGREQSYLDTLTPQQRDLISYVHGMPEAMQSAWSIAQISRILGILEDFTKQALLAQSEATAIALRAANPPKVVNGTWTMNAAQRAWFVAAGGALAAGAAAAARAAGLV